MARDGAFILSDVLRPTLSIVCQPSAVTRLIIWRASWDGTATPRRPICCRRLPIARRRARPISHDRCFCHVGLIPSDEE